MSFKYKICNLRTHKYSNLHDNGKYLECTLCRYEEAAVPPLFPVESPQPGAECSEPVRATSQ